MRGDSPTDVRPRRRVGPRLRAPRLPCLRALPQGAAKRRHAIAHHRARADRRSGLCSGAAGTANLKSGGPVGVVLAGGASRRLAGIPKGLELVGGSRVIDRVANALRAVSNDLLLAAND